MELETRGLRRDAEGRLHFGGQTLAELARRFGTPLHVAELDLLRERAGAFQDAFGSVYPGTVATVHPARGNDLAAVTRLLGESGGTVEITTEFELALALASGLRPERIVVGGVHKPDALIERAIELGLMALIVDSARELARVLDIAVRTGARSGDLPVLLRVRPRRIPRAADPGGVTSSRTEGWRGVDVSSGELAEALRSLAGASALRYLGPCSRLGVDLRDAAPAKPALEALGRAVRLAGKMGIPTTHVYICGGFASPTSREMSMLELLRYQGTFVLPSSDKRTTALPALAKRLVERMKAGLGGGTSVPHLLVESGRYVTGPSQVLLVTAHHIKRRRGVPPWVVTDGGAGTVAFPLYYETHEVVNASRDEAGSPATVTMVGPICYSTDWIYRNKPMAPIEPGDVLAVLDTGAYFSVTERTFGFPRPAVVGVSRGEARLLRRRETPEDVVRRDVSMALP